MRDQRRGERMRLGAFFHPTGNHVAAWLHPEAQIDAGTNFRHYAQITQTAERGKFDLMFVADAVAVRDGKLAALSRWPQYMAYFDPLTLLPALAAVTERIGLVATATTSYNEPYHIARKFASLDHISGGRAGWNVVTSSNVSEAYNFGRDQHYAHCERYDRANEFVEVVKGLWDSWDDDAFLRDRSTGRYFDPDKLHELNHKGTHFSVRGPLTWRGRRRGIRCCFRPAPRRPAASRRRVSPRACSRRSTASPPRRISTATSRPACRNTAGRPRRSKSCRGSMRSSAAPPRRRRRSTGSCNRKSIRMSVLNCCRTSSTTWTSPNTTSTGRCPKSPIMLPRLPVRPRCATSFAGPAKRG